mgnify:CR=1 FL=1
MSAQSPEDVKAAKIRSGAFNFLAKASESFGKGLIALVIAVIVALAGAGIAAAAIGAAAAQAWQAVQSVEGPGIILTNSQVQQIYQQEMQQAYEVVGFVTVLLLAVVYYAGKYVARGARLAWRGFSWLERVNAAPRSVEIRLGAVTFVLGSLLVALTLMASLWTGIITADYLASGNTYAAQEFLTTTLPSINRFSVASWVVLVLGGIATGYAFLRCARACGVGQAKGGAVASIVGFLLVLLSLLLPSAFLAVALKVVGLIAALAGFYKARGGYLLMR